MRLLIIRHAIAVPRGTPGIPDDERPLTPEGEDKFRKAARGLARIAERPEVLLTSPLPRALRTAEIAAEAWEKIRPTPTQVLADGDVAALDAILEKHRSAELVAIVGHEPDLSSLLALLLGTGESGRLEFRKGGAALVELAGKLRAGGRLCWYLPPKILRRLGD